MKKEKNPSEGERFIADYLRKEKIKFKTEVFLKDLKFDVKTHRKADFYLEDLKVYIEFYGMWNNKKEDRERYRKKKEVYRKNQIPCVYLYPENLGIIDYCFSQRLVEVLKKHELKKELFKYRLKRLFDDRGNLFGFILLFLFFLFNAKNETEKDKNLIIFYVSVIFYQLYRLFKGYLLFFKEDKYYNEFK